MHFRKIMILLCGGWAGGVEVVRTVDRLEAFVLIEARGEGSRDQGGNYRSEMPCRDSLVIT